MWVATYEEGLLHLDVPTNRITTYRNNPADPSSLSSDSVRTLLVDDRDLLWVGTDGGGFNLFNPDERSFTRFLHDPSDANSLNNDQVLSLAQDFGGVIWIGTYVGIGKFNPELGSFRTVRHRGGTAFADQRQHGQCIRKIGR